MINNRQGGRRRGRGGQRPQNIGGRPEGNRQDNRQRGNAAQLLEKYKSMARDAQLAGDRVQTEYYLQFADHYFRVLSESRARFEDQRPQRGDDLDEDDGEEDLMDGDVDQAGEEEQAERRPRSNRQDRGERQERQERPERQERANRPERTDRPEHNERPERGERPRRRFTRDERNDEGSGERTVTEGDRGSVAAAQNGEAPTSGLPFDALPPAIGVRVDMPSEEEARPRR
ncbi:MAG: DUF4167 domain-containing protein, partial [Sphingomicrobium sp.]